MRKQLLTILLASLLIAALLPTAAFAAEVAGGTENGMTWSIDTNGTLTISGTGEMKSAPWSSYYATVRSVVIQSGITSVCGNAFWMFPNLTSVTLPYGLKTIGNNAFMDCDNLVSITLPDTVTKIGTNAFLRTGVYNDPNNWYDHCLYIGNVLIVMDVNWVGGVTVRPGTRMLADSSFYHVELLDITFADSVRIIGEQAFMATGVPAFRLPEGIETIAYKTFSFCRDTPSVWIPKSVKRIEKAAFQGIEDTLKDVYYAGSEAEWKKIVIDNEGGFNDSLGIATIHYNSPVASSAFSSGPSSGPSSNETPADALYAEPVETVVTPAEAIRVNVATYYKVTLNGQIIDSSRLTYPLIEYKSITYFPATYYDSRFLGLVTDWNQPTQTFKIDRASGAIAYRPTFRTGTNAASYNTAKIMDCKVVVNGKTIDNAKEEYPLLLFRNVTYFPMTWRFFVDEFGCYYSYTHENGFVVNTK